MTKNASEGSTMALKPMADITLSPKQGQQWHYKMTYFLQEVHENAIYCWARRNADDNNNSGR